MKPPKRGMGLLKSTHLELRHLKAQNRVEEMRMSKMLEE